MLRCYDMTEGRMEPDDSSPPEAALQPQVERNDPPRYWQLPRLLAVSETLEDCRLIRIPPGFISC